MTHPSNLDPPVARLLTIVQQIAAAFHSRWEKAFTSTTFLICLPYILGYVTDCRRRPGIFPKHTGTFEHVHHMRTANDNGEDRLISTCDMLTHMLADLMAAMLHHHPSIPRGLTLRLPIIASSPHFQLHPNSQAPNLSSSSLPTMKTASPPHPDPKKQQLPSRQTLPTA